MNSGQQKSISATLTISSCILLVLFPVLVSAQSDSTQQNDSIYNVLLRDSLARVDSIAYIDSIRSLPVLAMSNDSLPEVEVKNDTVHPVIPEGYAPDSRATSFVGRNNHDDRSLVFYIAIFQLFLLAIAKLLDSSIIERHFYGFYKSIFSRLEYREEEGAANILLYINAFASIATFSYLAIEYGGLQFIPNAWYFILMIVLLGIIISFKRILINVFGFIIEKQNLIRSIKQISENGLVILGVLFIPVVLLINYSSRQFSYYLLGILVLLGVLIYLINLFRGVRAAFASGEVNAFHLFSYICASEIFTVLFIYKGLRLLIEQ